MPNVKKIIFLTLALEMAFLPGFVWAGDCLSLQNMAVKILKQENSRVYFSWKTQLLNGCEKPVTATVQLQMVDEKGANLDISAKNGVSLFANETREIQHEKSLPSDLFYKIQAYNFRTTEIPNY